MRASVQSGAHGVALERGVVARQRRKDDDGGVREQLGEDFRLVREALEAAQLAEGLGERHLLVNHQTRAIFAVHMADVELGLLVVLAQTVEQAVGRRNAAGQRQAANGCVGVAVEVGSGIGHVSERLDELALRFVELIQHGS